MQAKLCKSKSMCRPKCTGRNVQAERCKQNKCAGRNVRLRWCRAITGRCTSVDVQTLDLPDSRGPLRRPTFTVKKTSRNVQVERCKPKCAKQHKCAGRNVQAEICRLSGPTSTDGREWQHMNLHEKEALKTSSPPSCNTLRCLLSLKPFGLGGGFRCFRSLCGKFGPAQISRIFSETVIVNMPYTNWKLGMRLDIRCVVSRRLKMQCVIRCAGVSIVAYVVMIVTFAFVAPCRSSSVSLLKNMLLLDFQVCFSCQKSFNIFKKPSKLINKYSRMGPKGP